MSSLCASSSQLSSWSITFASSIVAVVSPRRSASVAETESNRWRVSASRRSNALGRWHRVTRALSSARGSDVNPLSNADIEEKLRTAAAGWNPRHDIAPLIAAIWSLDQSADVSRLASLTVRLS